jgi:hypothetical protein
MTAETNRVLSADEIKSQLVAIEKSAELASHRPNPDAVDRARRVLSGEISLDEAQAEILAKYTDTGGD